MIALNELDLTVSITQSIADEDDGTIVLSIKFPAPLIRTTSLTLLLKNRFRFHRVWP